MTSEHTRWWQAVAVLCAGGMFAVIGWYADTVKEEIKALRKSVHSIATRQDVLEAQRALDVARPPNPGR